ncbi:DUF2851 family protein [Flectobacillus roseus]|uniref:DUF2851 family protein n=1 Tax=Flectobacillus roseus TaxID=502259 RepID=UPI0024B6F26A|nr:DUF2851 family protein [Flectobacillus roseus]MDI9868149.1 DUF2851 family protein [Flectobacillus roseus]
MMQEAFLHHVWQFQKFNSLSLVSTQAEPIQVLKVGYHNAHAGADFLEAHIQIGVVEWVGSVEIHLKSSDWEQHTHQHDQSYGNVILHVVWENDREVYRHDGTIMPTLVVKDLIDVRLLQSYSAFMARPTQILCQGQFEEVPFIRKLGMLDKALLLRLEKKAHHIMELFAKCNQDWEDVAYRLLAKNFGFVVNAEPFMRLAENLPLKCIHKHRDNLFQIEAMVFGVAGLLEVIEENDDYQRSLKQEFKFLSAKYQLKPVIESHEWKFLRMRPANFPTVRLAQWAALIGKNANLFSLMIYFKDTQTIESLFSINTSPYWENHYRFGKSTETKVKSFGKSSFENILINTVVPLMAGYGRYKNEPILVDKAIAMLEEIKPEKNHILANWQELHLPIKNAADSQGALEWMKSFCHTKRCLSCEVGLFLLR